MNEPPAPATCPECKSMHLHATVHTITEVQDVESWDDGTVFIPVDVFEHPEVVDIHLACQCGWSSSPKGWEAG